MRKDDVLFEMEVAEALQRSDEDAMARTGMVAVMALAGSIGAVGFALGLFAGWMAFSPTRVFL